MRLLTISIIVFFSSALFAQNFDWTAQNSGVTVTLNDVFFTDSQTGWAVGNDGTIVNTTDGGQTWAPQASGTTEILRAVFFIDANTGWAVGGTLSKTMIKTTDGGSSWQNIAPGNIVANLMYDIAFADVNTGWLATFDSIYMTSDGGTTWVHEDYVSGVAVPSPRAIAVTSDTTAFIGGSMWKSVGSRQAEVFYRRPDNAPFLWGASGFDTFVTDDHINSIAFINSDIGFAGSQKGKLLKKTDFQPGGIWELNFQLPEENQTIWSLSFSDENHGMFNTSTELAGTTNALFYHTSNSGETWSSTPDTIPDFLLVTITAPDSNNAWAVGVGGKIYKGVRSPLGIHQTSLDFDVNIYPNPATDKVNVEINADNNEQIHYSLIDISGRIIQDGQWISNTSNARFTLSLSDINKGVYLLKLSTANGQSTFRVFKN
ncbi:MAG: YCF48-related protein [Bacteroidales bacterium]|nr:YCF48-related protein [Bacteroidales bacterium]